MSRHLRQLIRAAISARHTTWAWLDDDGQRTETTYPVVVLVLCESPGFVVWAYRTDNGQRIADQPFAGRTAKARALSFAAKGWADFEALTETRASA